MSQGNYVIDNLAGAGFRAAINEVLAAVATNNSGATEPAVMYAHQWWADTSANMLKRRNAGNTAWVPVMSLSLAITSYMETVLGAASAASARVLLNALSSSGGDLSGALNESRTTVASHATTADIWAALGNSINWTGSAATTTFPAAPQAGAKRRLHCAGACSFINSATLSIVGGADFVATAGAIVDVEAITNTTFRLIPIKADGTPIVPVIFSSSAENSAGVIEGKAVDPLGIREAFNATGSAPVYACRAWVNFNGTGSVAIRASGNVSSITDNGVGDYTVNFATPMQDANYAKSIAFSSNGSTTATMIVMSDCNSSGVAVAPTASAMRFGTFLSGVGPTDIVYLNVAVFR